MRIVHLSTNDVSGGAARAAFRLHLGLKGLGHTSKMLVLRKTGADPDVTPLRPAQDFLGRMRRKRIARSIHRDLAIYEPRPPGYELFSDDRTPYGPDLLAQIPPCDVINLHWVAGLLDHQSFFAGLPAGVPIVWRLADMAPLTGGCHYDDGCGRFEARCGACPQLGSRDEQDLSRQVWSRKKASIERAPLHLVATSNWIAAQSRRSSLLKDFPATVIPNGLDTAEFAPRDKAFSRDLLDLPREARIVLFAAESLDIRRKGFSHLLDALAGLGAAGADVLLVSVGGGRPSVGGGVRHVHLGRINNDRLLSAVYSAADLFVIPSLQESFGQTISESLACGTPAVGFATGGMLDMIRPGETGLLAPVGDTAALRSAILRLLDDAPGRLRMSQQARNLAISEYSLEVQAARYVRFYEKLLDMSAGSVLAK